MVHSFHIPPSICYMWKQNSMANFTSNAQSLTPSLSYIDIDSSMEVLNQLQILNTPFTENPQLSYQNLLAFSHNNFYCQQSPGFLGNLEERNSGLVHPGNQNHVQVSESIVNDEVQQSGKRKSMEVSESSSRNSHAPVPRIVSKKKNSSVRAKRVKNNDNIEEKSKEVVHVRARRGQATDSHSLAERVRRQKINERLKRLQNIVPGCYKAMGMALMLDEIINYVQSLQNQVEFLSMKLTTASPFYDFNSQTDLMETIQRENASEVKELERLMMMERQEGGVPGFQQGWTF